MFKFLKWFWRRAQSHAALEIIHYIEENSEYVSAHPAVPIKMDKVINTKKLISSIKSNFVYRESKPKQVISKSVGFDTPMDIPPRASNKRRESPWQKPVV